MTTRKNTTFSILFFIRKVNLKKSGESAIYVRVTVNGSRKESVTGKSVLPQHWNQHKEIVTTRGPEGVLINTHLKNIRFRLHELHTELESMGAFYTADTLIRYWLGNHESQKTILQVYREHNEKIRALIGKQYSAITVKRYETGERYLAELIREKYGKEDMNLNELSPELISEYDFFLEDRKNCCRNTRNRHLKCLKKLTRLAIANEWMKRDPFRAYKFREDAVKTDVLTMEELSRIYRQTFDSKGVELVRDVFLFCCFSGLAYIDVKTLMPSHIERDNEGDLWIVKERVKTGNACNVPLLDIALELIEKYKDHPLCKDTEYIFPVYANQKMNEYLKLIAEVCGIKKKLTTHVARHTFASTVASGSGATMQNVMQMMGHSDVRMTKHYTQVFMPGVKKDMQPAKEAFANFR